MTSSFCFADFELRVSQRLLLQNGQALQTGGRALDLLIVLVEQRHRVVAKAELLDLLWPGQALEPNNLAVQVWALRRLLGPGVIATVPGRGYQFVAATQEVWPAAALSTAAASSPTPASAPAAPALAVLAPMFGRADDLARLLALLQTQRLLTLLGPPGVGKTRLAHAAWAALAAAGETVVLADLAAVTDATAVEDAVRLALGQADGDRVAGAGRAWLGPLAARRLVLVLDNCEHLAAAVARLATAVLAQAPGVRLLATSQLPLNLPAEQQLRLQPLPVPAGTDAATARASPALQLLLARIRALDPGFVLVDADLPAALDLCRQLDGLPLAIELVAARVPALGLQGVRARLGQRLRLLTHGPAPQRHATMADALAWSATLLAPAQQRLLRTVGVFNGGFGLDLALQLGQALDLDEWVVLDGLGQLADHSLLQLEASGETPRLRLLETTRAFALDQLGKRGELARVRHCHAQAVCARLAGNGLAREQGRLSGDLALAGVRTELDNVRAAMDWVLQAPERAAVGHAIAADAWPAMMFLGLHHEMLRWMLALLPLLAADTPPRTAGFLLLGLGKLCLCNPALGPQDRHAALLRAQGLLDAAGINEYAMACRQTLAQSACQLGQPAAALAAAEQALALLQRSDAPAYRADLMVWRGTALALLGRQAEAIEARAQALPLCVPTGNDEFLFMLLCDLAGLESLLGLHAAAAGRWQFLTQAAAERGAHSHVLAPLWAGLQDSLLALGDLPGARAAAVEAWRHMSTLGCPLEGSHFHARLLALEGRPEQALWLVGAGDRQRREAGESRLLSASAARCATLARVQATLGDGPLLEAARRHGEALTPAEVAALLFDGRR